jgi:hypothetical protein
VAAGALEDISQDSASVIERTSAKCASFSPACLPGAPLHAQTISAIGVVASPAHLARRELRYVGDEGGRNGGQVGQREQVMLRDPSHHPAKTCSRDQPTGACLLRLVHPGIIHRALLLLACRQNLVNAITIEFYNFKLPLLPNDPVGGLG